MTVESNFLLNFSYEIPTYLQILKLNIQSRFYSKVRQQTFYKRIFLKTLAHLSDTETKPGLDQFQHWCKNWFWKRFLSSWLWKKNVMIFMPFKAQTTKIVCKKRKFKKPNQIFCIHLYFAGGCASITWYFNRCTW